MASQKDPRQSERNQTDKALENSNSASEFQADSNRDAKRVETDRANQQRRSDSDVSRDSASADVGTGLADRQDERLRKEREITDEALSDERIRADAATGIERSRHQAIAKSSAESLSQEQERHQKTKATLTTREEFLAIVSHDLRNPLNHISMTADQLLEEPKVKELAVSIKRSVGEMLRLIQDLLDAERIAEGKLALQCEQHEIGEIINQGVEQLQGSAASKGVILEAQSQDMCGAVLCDRGRVIQVLSNLIGNAIKFTPAKGRVCVTCQKTGSEAKEVEVLVSDTGGGIAPEKINTIFERFSQIHNQDRSGIGLGLYIAKMMVEEHSGRIWVESKLGEGSTFHFTLPFRPSAIGDAK